MALAVAIVLLVVLVVVQARRIGRLGRRIDRLTAGEDGRSLEDLLGQHLERVNAVVRDVSRLEGRTAGVEQGLRSTLGHVGLVRYNPFEDTGGAMSFALAILDGAGSGFVVSSLHARAGTRIYAKPIDRGRSEASLSKEETEAVRRAMAGDQSNVGSGAMGSSAGGAAGR